MKSILDVEGCPPAGVCEAPLREEFTVCYLEDCTYFDRMGLSAIIYAAYM